jgi:hypothetical protein
MKILKIIWDKIIYLLAGVLVTGTLTLFTPITDNIVKFFGMTHELVIVNRKIDDINNKIDDPVILKPDTTLYNILEKMNKQLNNIQNQQRIVSAKLDVLKESSEGLRQRFDDIERVSAMPDYQPKITVTKK